MRKWKSSLFVLITFLLTVLVAQTFMAAETGTTDDGFKWRNKNGVMAITGYKGTATTVNIPAKINGKPVTVIGDSTFEDNENIRKVIVPNSVTTIGGFAFNSCNNLRSITIPNSVTTIGEGAFTWCISLRRITIPNSVTTIGERAFSRCISLTRITIPNSVTTIEYGVFYECNSLKSITIPNSVTTIGEWAFSDCYSLESITIPNSVTTIKKDVFHGCSSLKSIKIPNSVTTIGEWAFSYCSSLENIKIPNSVTTIGESAFYYCSSLKSITLPDSVTTIEEYAFCGCINLKSITLSKTITKIGKYAFGFYDKDENEVKISGFIIYGYQGTAAEKYAKKNKFTFIELTDSGEVAIDLTPETEANEETAPTAEDQEEAILSLRSEETNKKVKGVYYGLLQARLKKAGKNSITLTWNKVNGATSYIVYGSKCAKNSRYKKLKTMKGTTYIQKKLKKGTYYKYLIVAVKDGKAITTSKTIHAATTGGKVGNYKSVNVDETSLSVKIGEKAKISAYAVPGSTKVTVKRHRSIAYESSNTNIATVSQKGVVKGIYIGTCYIYVYAQNGVSAKVKVTVKG